MKKIINKKIILGIILIGISITSVYAVTLIKASDVIYDNSKSNGSSNNVQGAIDELYSKVGNQVTEKLINEKIITYVTTLAKTDTINLAYDDTNDKNLRYIGSTPNNYVEFNGELWRIIGIMNNVSDANGTSTSRVKLIRSDSIGNYVFDNSIQYGSNDWSISKIMKTLNSGTYWNKNNGTCPYGTTIGATTACDFSSVGLTEKAKSMISNIIWNLGGNSSKQATAKSFYGYERGKNVYSGQSTSWTGYIGLMYPSDYGYAVGGNNRLACLTTNMNVYNNECYKNDWLHINDFTQWTITPYSSDKNALFVIYSTGALTFNNAYATYVVRPTVYLDTKLLITKGEGTLTNPYKISYTEEIVEETCIIKENSKNLITYITNLSKNDKTNLVTDDTIDKNIRYVGSNPNNYVEFNGELWRILGIMNNVVDKNGLSSSRVKIIRNETIGGLSWDNKTTGVGSSLTDVGSNEWKDATIMKTLNSGPYWNRTSGICYDQEYIDGLACDFSKTGLTSNAKNMISSVVWKLGGSNTNDITTKAIYSRERGNDVYSGRSKTWTGNVALIYPSDYGYAVGGSAREKCLATNISQYNIDDCINNNWIYKDEHTHIWTLTPSTTNASYVYRVHPEGNANAVNANIHKDIIPTVYLNTDIELTKGIGTEEDPFIIKNG